jgi:hypothetical protein
MSWWQILLIVLVSIFTLTEFLKRPLSFKTLLNAFNAKESLKRRVYFAGFKGGIDYRTASHYRERYSIFWGTDTVKFSVLKDDKKFEKFLYEDTIGYDGRSISIEIDWLSYGPISAYKTNGLERQIKNESFVPITEITSDLDERVGSKIVTSNHDGVNYFSLKRGLVSWPCKLYRKDNVVVCISWNQNGKGFVTLC